MTTAATHILEQFKQLSLPEKREIVDAILRESVGKSQTTSSPQKTVAEVAGKYRPHPTHDVPDHDRAFAEAILESKSRDDRS